MKIGPFMGVVTALEARVQRRHVLSWLAAGGVAVLLAQMGIGGSDAKKKKKRCKAGRLVGSVIVPATGATVNSQALKKGQRHQLRASGFWLTNAQFGNDALAAFALANPATPQLTFNNVRLGLSVDGGSPDLWGSYSTGHVYEREIVGTGAPVALRFTDPQVNDNSGSLSVEIFCA